MQLSDLEADPVDRVAHPETEIERDLVVARARRVQPPRGRADDLGEPAFHIHMDVFEGAREREGPRLDFASDLVLNSSAPNEMMKDFQARGLFGARHVHKKILDVYFPKFNEKNKNQLKLALLSEQAHAKAKAYIEANLPKHELSAVHLGRYRVEIKKHLKEEMEDIDRLVGEIIR